MKVRDLVRFVFKKRCGAINPRIRLKLYFEVLPASWNSWPLYETLEEAMVQAEKDTKTAILRDLRREKISELS